jgi:hypothetical protein
MNNPKETSLFILSQLMGQVKVVKGEPDDDYIEPSEDWEERDDEFDTDVN